MHHESFEPERIEPPREPQPLLQQELTHAIIGAAMRVHSGIGPGLPEPVYRRALMIELRKRGLAGERERQYDVFYEGESVGQFRADVVVNEAVICELKAVECLSKDHEAQLLSYLKASGLRVGMLLNFGRARLEQKRMVN
jgi:GxxExxY protein